MESWVLRNSLSYMTGFLFLKLFFRGSQVLCLRVFVGVPLRESEICLSVSLRVLRECETHLSSVAHTYESTHWLESTGSTGQEVGAVVRLQEANKVGALRLWDTERWTFITAAILKENYVSLPTSSLSVFTNISGTAY